MLTVCIYIMSSLISSEADSWKCMTVSEATMAHIVTECALADKDPLATCEVKRYRNGKAAVIVRQLELASTVTSPAVQKEGV